MKEIVTGEAASRAKASAGMRWRNVCRWEEKEGLPGAMGQSRRSIPTLPAEHLAQTLHTHTPQSHIHFNHVFHI